MVVDLTEFIRNYINTSRTAIYDYCFSQKVAGKYTTIYKTVRDGKPVYIKIVKSIIVFIFVKVVEVL